MINGVNYSEIQTIRRNHLAHKERLREINFSNPRKNFHSQHFEKMLSTKRSNHGKWVSFQRKKQQNKLGKKNEKIFDKLLSIALESGPYCSQQRSPKTFYRHHNSKVQNLRKSKVIKEENPILFKRFQKKQGYISHVRDMQQFRKTRQIVNRMQKFPIITRMIKLRTKTLPSKRSSFQGDNSQILNDQ